jgi:phosphoglycerate dehydrogenase-like enzyme
MPADRFESYLPDMALLIGQSDVPKSCLDRAPKLRAIINVETNFLQNVDYDACFERGIHVLAPGSAFARPVAEMALGMAIDLCRGVTTAAKAYCRPPERVYGVKDSDRGIEHIAQSRFRGVIVPLRAA